jgi:mRNA interferase MazF
MKAPSRGDVWIVDLGFAGKVRPRVVLSVPSLDQDRALVTVIPHTTSARGSRFEVRIAKRFLDEGAFDAQNPVTLAPARLIRRLGALSAQELVAIEDAVRLWLGLQ